MRLSIAAGALCGAAASSALTIPTDVVKGARLVDLAQFESGKFEMGAPPPQSFSTRPGVNSTTLSGAAPATKNNAATGNAAAAGNCPSRVEWRRLNDNDKSAFVGAVRCLMNKPSAGGYPGSQSRYEDLVSVHQQMTPEIHMVGQFLPWHRYYIAIFEDMLRSECGYQGPMTWWDESLDAGNFHNSPLFTSQWFGSAPFKTSDGQGACVDDGAFAGVQLHLGPGGGYSTHCLSRAVDESLTAQCNMNFVNYCNQFGSFTDMESCAEGGPHAYGHNGIGAVMSDVAPAPSDPVFFMHHGFIDRNWNLWQRADPANRLYQVGGSTVQGGGGPTLDLNFQLTSRGIRGPVTVNQMMDISGPFFCYDYDS